MASPLDNAVEEILKMKRDNPKWDFSFIVGKISKWHHIPFDILMAEIGRRNKKYTKKPKTFIKKRERREDPYPESAPWWIKY